MVRTIVSLTQWLNGNHRPLIHIHLSLDNVVKVYIIIFFFLIFQTLLDLPCLSLMLNHMNGVALVYQGQ